ncbi:PAS domain-containing protein [Oceanihabitans sp. IOP_32]|uniref:PAS domain-containing protein n=1 Tax=Oceanihabitans sp. IOP_32 TaxID=2529032 RepID=UPI0012936289|nr:PAS domain-containing protein [Oceanihabitans sp. IOP_32]QFZ55220.1 PAS domain-containing protein [Oceanihabitans sp. IOP_32]
MKYNLSRMMCLDIFLSYLPPKPDHKIIHDVKLSGTKTTPLLSWDMFSQNYCKTLANLEIENDIETVRTFARKVQWKNEIDTIFNNRDFEALIITDAEQNIIWVNSGFTKMTGYSKKFAIDKNPKFLQGIDTSIKTKRKIKKKLNHLKPFTEVITNYRKDNTPYKCEVTIIPMYNDTVTHFLAIEKQVV